MASSESFSPSISAVTRSPMMSSVGCVLASIHLFEEVILQRRRRFERLLVLDGVADEVDGPLAEHGQIRFGQAQQLGDHAGGELEGEVLDQIRLAGVDELVDEPVDDGSHDLGLPPHQRLGLERRRHQIAVRPVLGSAHGEDGRADEHADGGVVHRRVEGLAVPVHRVDRVERHGGVALLGAELFGRLGVVHDRALEDTVLRSLLREEGVGVAVQAGPVERLLADVLYLGVHHGSPTRRQASRTALPHVRTVKITVSYLRCPES